MKRSGIPSLDKDVKDLLHARGFKPVRVRKDGSVTTMKFGNVYVYSRANAARMMVTAAHVSATYYCMDDVELKEALENIKCKEILLDDAVRTLADNVFRHFHESGVPVSMTNVCGTCAFSTTGTTSVIELFRLVGTLDNWNDVEIVVKGQRDTTGPVSVLGDVLAVFEEWAGYADTTALECHDAYAITLQAPEYNIHAMLYRGLKDIQEHVYHLRQVADVEFLQNVVNRHENADVRDEPRNAYTITWKLSQKECEEREGLHA